MGDKNSSVTRVWPVFETLLARDPTGKQWLEPLMWMAAGPSRCVDPPIGDIEPYASKPARDIPCTLSKVLNPALTNRLGRLRNCFERELCPPEEFLRWTIENPDRLTWPREKDGSEKVFSHDTQGFRKGLLPPSPDPTTRDGALRKLGRCGAAGSRGKWWAFEGFTSVDCYFETDHYVIVIEGKRTEALSVSTDWYPKRNQLLRNLEVSASEASRLKKNYAVILCAENPVPPPCKREVADSFPHKTNHEQDDLLDHYLGCVTWEQIVASLCPGTKLPNSLDEAVKCCLNSRK